MIYDKIIIIIIIICEHILFKWTYYIIYMVLCVIGVD